MKIKNLIALSTLALGFGALVSLKPIQRFEVRAEEETTQVVEEIEHKQHKFIDELVTPLIIALGSADVITVVAFIASAVVKNKKEKSRIEALNSLTEIIGTTIKNLHEVEEKTQEMLGIFKNSYGNTVNLIESEKQVLLTYKEDLEKVNELKNVLVAMAEAELAQIKSQKENIKSGLAHEVSQIEEKLRALK